MLPVTSMELKERPRRGLFRHRVVLVACGLGLYTGALVAVVCLLDHDFARCVRGLPGRLLGAASDKVEAAAARMQVQPDRLDIDIGLEHWQRILADRERAFEQRRVDSRQHQWVPARIRHGGASAKIRLRLKGTFRDHWSHSKKWSFLIKVRGDATIKRMKRFSIQHPRTRKFIHEWLLLEALRREELIALRLEFVEVYINGTSHGLYALEEQPAKRLVENHGLRAGPIVGFDKGDWIAYWNAHHDLVRLGFEDPSWFLKTAPIEAAQSGSVVPGSESERTHVRALALLEAFRDGRAAASEAFDLDEMAKLAAVHAVLGAADLDWKDLTFYYNPITARLQPIGKELLYDREIASHRWWVNEASTRRTVPLSSAGSPTRQVSQRHGRTPPFVSLLFEDEEFERLYVEHLDRMSRPSWAVQFLHQCAQDLEHNLALLATEFPSFEFSPEDLHDIGRVIHNTLYPARPANAYVVEASGGQVRLEVSSHHPFTSHVVEGQLANGTRLPLASAAALPGRKLSDVASHRTITLDLPPEIRWADELIADLRLVVRVPGLERDFLCPVLEWPRHPKTNLEDDVLRTLPSDFEREFLVVRENIAEIRCKPGSWTLDEPLVIPPGYRVLAGPGVHWDLRSGAFVLSYSPVELVGSAERPVLIESSDGTGGGLVVIKAERESRLEHFVGRGLSAPSRGDWSLTGAITFYESPVTFVDAWFGGNRRGDDFVNLVRSSFSVERSVFDGIAGDAIDLDFCRGHVTDTTFRDVGNDALDACGTRVDVTGVTIRRAGDKGLSFGEASRASLSNVEIAGARVGLASKDSSVVRVLGCVISESETGIAVFNKKPEFGPGRLEAEELRLLRCSIDVLVERGSTLVLDGEPQPAEDENVGHVIGR